MEPARTHISERSHKSTAKLPFSGNCPLFRVAGTPFFFRQCERKAIAAETGAWAGARLQEQSPQSCRKRGAAQVVCVQRTRPNQWLVCWYKREKGWIVQQLPRRRLEVHIQIHWNESGKHVSRLAGDCAESGVIKQAETCAQCCRSCSRGIPSQADSRREIPSVRIVNVLAPCDKILESVQRCIKSTISGVDDLLVLRCARCLQMSKLLRTQSKCPFNPAIGFLRDSGQFVSQAQIERKISPDFPILLNEQIETAEPKADRGIRNWARAYRLKESRGSPQRRKDCPRKQAVIGSEWAEWIQHAHVRHLAVTEHNERPKIAIR